MEMTVGRAIKWLGFVITYLTIFRVFEGFLLFLAIVAIAGPILFVLWAYKEDKIRDQATTEEFSGENLFFRYGTRIVDDSIVIPLPSNLDVESVKALSQELITAITEDVKSEFSDFNVSINNEYPVIDKTQTEDTRLFSLMNFTSPRGSEVNHFIRMEQSGANLVAFFFTHFRGVHSQWDLYDHAITAPLHALFWVTQWYRNQTSIIANISKSVNNAFDKLDVKTFIEASNHAIYRQFREVLVKHDLLVESVERAINVSIDNSQNISISDSSDINIGSIANRARGAVDAIRGKA